MAPQLQRHRLLRRVETQMPVRVAVNECAGRHHLGIQQRVRRQQTQEIAVVPVGPIQHGRDAETAVEHEIPGFGSGGCGFRSQWCFGCYGYRTTLSSATDVDAVAGCQPVDLAAADCIQP